MVNLAKRNNNKHYKCYSFFKCLSAQVRRVGLDRLLVFYFKAPHPQARVINCITSHKSSQKVTVAENYSFQKLLSQCEEVSMSNSLGNVSL